MSLFHLFPYSLVNKGSKIIIAGAGEVGKSFVEQISKNQYCEIVVIVDRNYQHYDCLNGIKVVSPRMIKNYVYDKIVIAVSDEKKQSVLSDLLALEINKNQIISEKYPYYHLQDQKLQPPIETVEAVIIKSVFDAIGIKNPSYMDVGACHPHMSSNTMLFYVNGSRGINIEPDASLKEEFVKYRPNDINLFVGVAAKSGEGKFYKCKDPYLSSFSPEAIKWSTAHQYVDYDDFILVPLMTLNEIVDKYNNGEFPDFIDVDIEGMDAEVLESLDVSKSSPKVICVEGNVSIFNDILMKKKCLGDGYMPYCRITYNTIYLRRDIYKQILNLK